MVSLDSGHMTLGARIQQRINELGISQAELARRVGIRQSTLNSLINGTSRTSRSLLKIAHELQTSPEYLTGDVDDPEDEVSNHAAYSHEEFSLLSSFRKLDALDRQALLRVIDAMARNPATMHDNRRAYLGNMND